MEGEGEAEADAEPEAEPELELEVDEPVALEEPPLETAVTKPEPVEVELLPVVVADESEEVEVSASIQSQLPRSDNMYNVDHHPNGCHRPLPTV